MFRLVIRETQKVTSKAFRVVIKGNTEGGACLPSSRSLTEVVCIAKET